MSFSQCQKKEKKKKEDCRSVYNICERKENGTQILIHQINDNSSNDIIIIYLFLFFSNLIFTIIVLVLSSPDYGHVAAKK